MGGWSFVCHFYAPFVIAISGFPSRAALGANWLGSFTASIFFRTFLFDLFESCRCFWVAWHFHGCLFAFWQERSLDQLWDFEPASSSRNHLIHKKGFQCWLASSMSISMDTPAVVDHFPRETIWVFPYFPVFDGQNPYCSGSASPFLINACGFNKSEKQMWQIPTSKIWVCLKIENTLKWLL